MLHKPKHLFTMFSIIVSCALLSTVPVHAAVTPAEQQNVTAEYDILQGGSQEFTLYDAEGNPVYVTIEEESTIYRVADRTYSVSFKSPMAWEAGYKVDVKNNTISSVHSPWSRTILGTISAQRLVKESSTQATYYFTYKITALSTYQGVRTKVSSSKITVTNV